MRCFNLVISFYGLVISCGFQFDPLVANTLMVMYFKFGKLSDVVKLFSAMPNTTVVTWIGMIVGYVQNGFMDEASLLFFEMISAGVKPNFITFASFLPSITDIYWCWCLIFRCEAIQGK